MSDFLNLIVEVYDERQLLKQREILERALVAVERQFSTTKQELFKERSQLYEIRIKELKEDPDKNPDLKKAISELQEDTEVLLLLHYIFFNLTF